MIGIRHYRVVGEDISKFLDDWQSRWDEAKSELLRFSRRVGGHPNQYGSAMSFGRPVVAIKFITKSSGVTTAPNGDWKACGDFWVPRRGTKAQRALSDELKAIEQSFPSLQEIGDRIKMPLFSGCHWRTVGVNRVRGEWYLVVPDDYKPIAGLERVSDIDMEAMVAKARSSKTKRRARQ